MRFPSSRAISRVCSIQTFVSTYMPPLAKLVAAAPVTTRPLRVYPGHTTPSPSGFTKPPFMSMPKSSFRNAIAFAIF